MNVHTESGQNYIRKVYSFAVHVDLKHGFVSQMFVDYQLCQLSAAFNCSTTIQ